MHPLLSLLEQQLRLPELERDLGRIVAVSEAYYRGQAYEECLDVVGKVDPRS